MLLFVKFNNYSRKERKREWEKRKLNVVGVLLCVFVIIKLLCCRFSAVILKRIQFMFFFCFFLLTHPGQRRHSGDSSYWRRPRDGGRQNKERQGVHARTYGTTHLFNSHTHRELYVLCLIFRLLVLVVKFWLLFYCGIHLLGGWRWWSSSSSSSVAEDSQSEFVCLLVFVAC